MDYKDVLYNSFLGCSTMTFSTNRNIVHFENIELCSFQLTTLEEKTVTPIRHKSQNTATKVKG